MALSSTLMRWRRPGLIARESFGNATNPLNQPAAREARAALGHLRLPEGFRGFGPRLGLINANVQQLTVFRHGELAPPDGTFVPRF
jgi:hypothetical protein